MKHSTSIFDGARCLGAALAIVATAMSSGSAAAAAATPFGENLVKNPGAEAGGVGTNVPNWEISPDFAVGAYGGAGMPSKKQGNAIGGEKQLFSTGPYVVNFDTCGSALQFIKLKNVSGPIDSGNVRVTVSGFLGTKTKADTAYVSLQFRDGNNEQIGANLDISASTKGKMSSKTKSKAVPKGTRILRVQLQGDLLAQTCDAFFDNVSVILDQPL